MRENEANFGSSDIPQTSPKAANRDFGTSLKDSLLKESLAQLPWRQSLLKNDSEASKLVKSGSRKFKKYESALLQVFSDLERKKSPYDSLTELFD